MLTETAAGLRIPSLVGERGRVSGQGLLEQRRDQSGVAMNHALTWRALFC